MSHFCILNLSYNSMLFFFLLNNFNKIISKICILLFKIINFYMYFIIMLYFINFNKDFMHFILKIQYLKQKKSFFFNFDNQ